MRVISFVPSLSGSMRVADVDLQAVSKRNLACRANTFEAHVRGFYKQMARITIAPTWARVYDFGAGRLPNFLRRLVDSTCG
jgi:hypothetical protein